MKNKEWYTLYPIENEVLDRQYEFPNYATTPFIGVGFVEYTPLVRGDVARKRASWFFVVLRRIGWLFLRLYRRLK